MEKIYNYINGDLVKPNKDNWLENYDPAIGKVYSLIPDSDDQDVDSAYKAAKEAFPLWSKKSVKYRSDILQKIADLINKNLDELSLAESIDNGKPLALAKKVDIPRAATNMSFFATAVLHDSSDAHQQIS